MGPIMMGLVPFLLLSSTICAPGLVLIEKLMLHVDVFTTATNALQSPLM